MGTRKRRKWYEIYLQEIKDVLSEAPAVLRVSELRALISESRESWKTPKTMGNDEVIELFAVVGLLNPILITDPQEQPRTLYSHGKPGPLQVAAALKPDAYLSHATAASINNLSRNIQRTIYVTKEQSEKPPSEAELTQEAIDSAFSKPQRITREKYLYQDETILLLNGKHTGNMGVGVSSPENGLRVTRTERTLIDMAVRPDYSGGVYQVLEAYERAKDHVAIAVLLSIFKKLDFIYPYHQAIGFYLEKAGYPSASYSLFKKLGFEFKFYLCHGLNDYVLDEEWQLYIPVGMEIAR